MGAVDNNRTGNPIDDEIIKNYTTEIKSSIPNVWTGVEALAGIQLGSRVAKSSLAASTQIKDESPVKAKDEALYDDDLYEDDLYEDDLYEDNQDYGQDYDQDYDEPEEAIYDDNYDEYEDYDEEYDNSSENDLYNKLPLIIGIITAIAVLLIVLIIYKSAGSKKKSNDYSTQNAEAVATVSSETGSQDDGSDQQNTTTDTASTESSATSEATTEKTEEATTEKTTTEKTTTEKTTTESDGGADTIDDTALNEMQKTVTYNGETYNFAGYILTSLPAGYKDAGSNFYASDADPDSVYMKVSNSYIKYQKS